MKTAFYAGVIGAALLLVETTPAVLARGGAPRQTCTVDLKALCAGIAPGEGRVRACFISHIGDLSTACSAKLSRAAYVAKECEADVKRFCGKLKSGRGRIAACMKPHLRDVGQPCKRALAFVAAPGNNP